MLGNLTQEDVAEASGLSVQYVRKIESSREVNPSYVSLLAIAKALGVALDELVGEAL
jgi:transcriptional regulator with XRE-family HTH domain